MIWNVTTPRDRKIRGQKPGVKSAPSTSPFPSSRLCAFLAGVRNHAEQVVIPFGDADPAGIVFYPRLIALAHNVVENLIRDSSLGWSAWFASPDHGAPVCRVEADFLLPMAAGATFTAHAQVEKVGETSVAFVVEFRGDRGEVAALVRTVHVLVDKATGKPTTLSEAMRRVFSGQTR